MSAPPRDFREHSGHERGDGGRSAEMPVLLPVSGRSRRVKLSLLFDGKVRKLFRHDFLATPENRGKLRLDRRGLQITAPATKWQRNALENQDNAFGDLGPTRTCGSQNPVGSQFTPGVQAAPSVPRRPEEARAVQHTAAQEWIALSAGISRIPTAKVLGAVRTS